MPLIRTRNAVFLLGTAIGFAASASNAGAESPIPAQEPFVVAQAAPAVLTPEEEKKKKEEELRKRKLQQQQQQQQQQPGAPKGSTQPPQQRIQPGGGGTPPVQQHIQRDPGRTIEKPPVQQQQPDLRRKKEEDLRRDQRPPADLPPGRTMEKPPVQQQKQLDLGKKKEEDLRRKKEEDLQRGQPGTGLPQGRTIEKPPVVQPKQPDLGRKKDDDLHKGTAGDKHPGTGLGQPQGGPAGKSLTQPKPLDTSKKLGEEPHRGRLDDRKRDEIKTGQPPVLPKGSVVDKSGPGAPPILLHKPTAEELDTRRKQRHEFSRERLKDVAGQRKEQRDASGRTVIVEPGNRRIMKENGRAFIQHDESERFRGYGRDFRTETGPRGERRAMFTRPDGVVIITIVDEDGRLIRRMRRDRDGREFVLIDNRRERPHRHRGRAIGGFGFFVELPPPVIRIPHERYYVDAGEASEDDIYEALSAPPVDDIEPDYTLDEIRHSPSLRDRLRRVSLSSINFDFGSWELREDHIDRLDGIARAIRAILRRNPDEVFLVGGHTDAVGSDEDNLSLSDRRADAVARVLTDEFGIPAENLVTQGYGEQYLLIDIQGPEVRNRRVEFQRITPALARDD